MSLTAQQLKILASLIALLLTFSSLNAGPGHHQKVDLYSQQIKENPNQAELYLLRAVQYLHGQHNSEAWDDIKKAESLNSLDSNLNWAKYLYFSNTKKLDLALQHLNREIEINSPSEKLLLLRSELYQTLKNNSLAEADHKALLQISEALQPETYLYLANYESKRLRPRQALMILNLGLEKLGPIFSLALQKTKVLQMLGKNEEALLWVDQKISKMTHQAKTYCLKGEIYESMNQKELAHENFKMALQSVNKSMTQGRRAKAFQDLAMEIQIHLARFN